MLIRPAATRDARAIARVQVRGWQIGYRGIVPDEFLARMTFEERTNRWLANLAELDRPQTIVAEDEDEVVVGWAAFGANRSDLGPEVGELGGLYIDPDHWDQGAGGMLLAEAEHQLTLAGYQCAILWTLAENLRTRRFYETRSWHFDGATDTHPSGAEVVRYAKELQPRVDPDAASA
jgi:GNAT superfamily N-acetyltransferase